MYIYLYTYMRVHTQGLSLMVASLDCHKNACRDPWFVFVYKSAKNLVTLQKLVIHHYVVLQLSAAFRSARLAGMLVQWDQPDFLGITHLQGELQHTGTLFWAGSCHAPRQTVISGGFWARAVGAGIWKKGAGAGVLPVHQWCVRRWNVQLFWSFADRIRPKALLMSGAFKHEFTWHQLRALPDLNLGGFTI